MYQVIQFTYTFLVLFLSLLLMERLANFHLFKFSQFKKLFWSVLLLGHIIFTLTLRDHLDIAREIEYIVDIKC